MDKRRERQKLIIEKARETYIEKGLFNTVMDNIADKANITRRTLYRYFETKEELAYEVTIEILKDWNNYQLGLFETLEGRGIDRLHEFLINSIGHLRKMNNTMKYLGEFDSYFHDNNLPQSNNRSANKLSKVIHVSDDLLKKIIILGQADNSIISDIDIDLTVSTISNILWSFCQRIAIRNNTMQKETSFSGMDLIRNQVKLYIMALEKRRSNERS